MPFKHTCEQCDKSFTTKHRHSRFCHPKCWYAFRRENEQNTHRALDKTTCPICGKLFQPAHSRIQYCSPECGYASRKGYSAPREDVELPDPRPNRYEIPAAEFFGKQLKLGIVSDTHLGSKWERLDALNAMYDVYVEEGVRHVLHAGNIVEGDAKFNQFDVRVRGLEAQTEYCLEHYPQRPGIVTHFVTGDDHEGWWIQREGIDYGRFLESSAERGGRTDLRYIGHVEADVELKASKGSSVLKIMHPGGGSSYAVSYAPQKIVESFQGGEKPQALICGHYHKFDFGYPREVWVVQPGCFQDQSIWMRKKKLQGHLGGCLVTLNQAPTGELNRFGCEFLAFYDHGFYEAKYGLSTRKPASLTL